MDWLEVAAVHMDWVEVAAVHIHWVEAVCTVAKIHLHQRILVEAHQAVVSAVLFLITSTVMTTSEHRAFDFHVPVLGLPLGSTVAR